jgi:hypothetical protein
MYLTYLIPVFYCSTQVVLSYCYDVIRRTRVVVIETVHEICQNVINYDNSEIQF